MPIWRKVVFTPEAMPERVWLTTPTAVEASGGLTMPLPTPATTKPGTRWVHEVSSIDAGHEQESRHSDQEESRADQPANRHVRGEPPGNGGRHQAAGGDREETEPGAERRVAEIVLEVEDQVHQHRVQGSIHAERGDEASSEGRDPEEGQVEHRMGHTALDRYEPTRNTAARIRQMVTPESPQPSSPARIRP
jgi:hypothetical protein